MKLILLIFFILTLNTYSLKTKGLDLAILKLNSVCRNLTPHAVVEKESWTALVCGVPLKDSELNYILKNTGLIHIFVISGAQLIIIDHALSFLKLGLFLRLILGFLFCLMSGFQPPIFRGFIHKVISILNKKAQLDWPSETVTLFTGLMVLVLIPEWSRSLSLSLSWVASLSQSLRLKKEYQKILAAYLLMMFPLWGISNIHPITVLMNLLVAPIIGFVLFPLALVLILFPAIHHVFDFLIYVLRQLQYFIPNQFTIIPHSSLPPQIVTWIYVLGLHAVIHMIMISIRRDSWKYHA